MKTEQEIKAMLERYLHSQVHEQCFTVRWYKNKQVIEALEWVLDYSKSKR